MGRFFAHMCFALRQDHIKAAARAVLNNIILEIEAEEASANSDEDATDEIGPCEEATAAGLVSGAAAFAPPPADLQACHYDIDPCVLTRYCTNGLSLWWVSEPQRQRST